MCSAHLIRFPFPPAHLIDFLSSNIDHSFSLQAFSLVSMSFLTLFVNIALTLYRAKLAPSAAPAPPPAYPGHTAATPFPSAHPAYFHPAYLPSPAPGWGPAWHPDEDAPGTPSRRRRLEGGVEKVR